MCHCACVTCIIAHCSSGVLCATLVLQQCADVGARALTHVVACCGLLHIVTGDGSSHPKAILSSREMRLAPEEILLKVRLQSQSVLNFLKQASTTIAKRDVYVRVSPASMPTAVNLF